MNRAHPVFSRAGCLSGLLLALGVAAAIAVSGGAIFSPGELTAHADDATPAGLVASHADIGNDCGQCHAPFAGVTAERCLQCHAGVDRQRAVGTGLHGSGEALQAARCETCHRDHQGRDFDPSAAALAQFDHSALRFTLARHVEDYAGQPLGCAGCHRLGDYEYEPAACVECHGRAEPIFMAQHGAAFGLDCLVCHDGADAMSGFDHAATGFRLDGQHAALKCVDCHQARAPASEAKQCLACHAEPAIHAGLFGTRCEACHSTTAWQPARLTQHSFPLDHGGEGEIVCATCHTETYAAYVCTNCHAHAPAEVVEKHADEGIVGERLLECTACHPGGEKD